MTEPTGPATPDPSEPGEPAPSAANIPRPTIEQFRILDEGNRMLAGDVRGLTESLALLQQLQENQRETDRRAREAQANVNRVERESTERNARVRRSFTLATGAMAILLPLVSILVYASLIQHVDNLLSQQRRDRIASCQARNAGTLGNIAREEILAELDENPAVQKAHRDSVVALRASLIDCDANRPTAPTPNPAR